MYEKVKAYVQEYAMLEQSDHVIAGISGGADSICLLCVLLELQKEYGFEITGVHVNHGLRGEDADRDEAYVRAFCDRANVPLLTYRVDVATMAKGRGLSAEEAGREARREAFTEASEKCGGTKIALAHHLNDNVETVILNLVRGTGLKGAAGIRPVNDSYIRPLLCVKREEIEKYLQKNCIDYCIDQTNLEDIYTRNKIRNRVIPYLESEVNEKASEHIANFSRQMMELQNYMERQTSAALERCCQQRQLDIELFEQEDKVLQPYILKRFLCRAAGKEKDIETIHVELLQNLMKLQTGRRISLPYGLVAERSYGEIILKSEKDENQAKETDIFLPEVEMRVFECEKMPETFPESPYTKWFDYDIIKSTVIVRNWEIDDYITIDNKGNTQKLKKYFVNAKIPQEQRGKVLLAADGNHILWIVGYRQNQAYQVSEQTKRILEITINGGKGNGRNS